MPQLYTIRGLARSTVWMRAWKIWICGAWSKIWAERALQEWGRPDQQPYCQGHCDHVARVFFLHVEVGMLAEADAASSLCACNRKLSSSSRGCFCAYSFKHLVGDWMRGIKPSFCQSSVLGNAARMGVLGNAAQSELWARCAAKEFSALNR